MKLKKIIEPKTGFAMPYKDSGSGLIIPSVWVEINTVQYTPNSSCLIIYDVYANHEKYELGNSPIFGGLSSNIPCCTKEWDKYFDQSIMQKPGHDIVTQVLLFLKKTLTKKGK